MKLVSDERVFERLEMGLRLRVPLDVEVGDVRLERRVHFGRQGVPHSRNSRSFSQLTFLIS